MSRAHHPGFFLDASSELQTLKRQALRLLELGRVYAEISPPALAQFSTVACFRNGVLSVAADNGAIAAKLKQLAPTLVTKLQKRGYEVTAIRITTQASTPAPRKAEKPALSEAALENLRALEARLEDSPLRTALARMLRRHGS